MAENDFLTYKGKPLVRKGNEIYYGDMAEKFIAKLDVKSSKQQDGRDVPDLISVQLLKSDTDIAEKDRVVKNSNKNGFYEAMDLAAVWLERALKD